VEPSQPIPAREMERIAKAVSSSVVGPTVVVMFSRPTTIWLLEAFRMKTSSASAWLSRESGRQRLPGAPRQAQNR
jgi:hypothetical protein